MGFLLSRHHRHKNTILVSSCFCCYFTEILFSIHQVCPGFEKKKKKKLIHYSLTNATTTIQRITNNLSQSSIKPSQIHRTLTSEPSPQSDSAPMAFLTTSISLTHLLDYSRVKKPNTYGGDICSLLNQWGSCRALELNGCCSKTTDKRKNQQPPHFNLFFFH